MDTATQPAWLPVPEGSQWVWTTKPNRVIVEVLSVDGPSPESMVTIKVPFSPVPQRWPAKDFGKGQKFEPIPFRPPAVGDLFQQAREWMAMVHPYPSLEECNAHGLELVGAIALEIGCEATVPEGLIGARLKDAIAEALAGMLEPAKGEVEDDLREVTDPEELARINAAGARRFEEYHPGLAARIANGEPAEQSKRKGRRKAEAPEPTQTTAEPQTLDEFQAARDHHLAEANRLTARMRELHEAERAQVLAQLATLDQRAEEMGLSA